MVPSPVVSSCKIRSYYTKPASQSVKETYLRGRSSRDKRSSRVLDLHLVQKHVAVLGDLDVSGAGHEHLHGPLRPEVGLQHVLDALRGRDVDSQGLSGSRQLGLRVQHGDGSHP